LQSYEKILPLQTELKLKTMVKAFLSLAAMLFMSINSYPQLFTCSEIPTDSAWNAMLTPKIGEKYERVLKGGKKKMVKATIADQAYELKERKQYKTNDKGEIEYVYIFRTEGNYDVTLLRDIVLNMLYEGSHLSNEEQKNILLNSPKDGLKFVRRESDFVVIGQGSSKCWLDAKIHYDIRFKPNRIRFSVTIDDRYDYYSNASYTGSHYLYRMSEKFPFDELKSYNRPDWDSPFLFGKGFVDAVYWASIGAPRAYLNSLNERLAKRQEVVEDW